MAFSVVASVSTGSSDSGASVTTAAIDTTGADLIVLAFSFYAGSDFVMTDSKGNTWTALTPRNNGSNRQRLFYCVSPTVGSGHTWGYSAATVYPVISVLALAGADTADAFDQESGNSSAGATSIQPGSLTPDADNCIVIAGIENQAGTNLSINGGFTAVKTDAVGGNCVCGGIAYLIQTTAAAANPTWSWTTSAEAGTGLATFHAAAGGGSPVGGLVGGKLARGGILTRGRLVG
jgi:hypothetical protein